MKQGSKRHLPDRINIATQICDMYAKGEHNLSDCCQLFGINSRRTFYNWIDEIAQIAHLYKKAQKLAETPQFTRLKRKSRTALEKRVEGYYYDETKETIQDGGVKKRVTIRKHRPPSDKAIIFALTNKDPKNFRHYRCRQL